MPSPNPRTAGRLSRFLAKLRSVLLGSPKTSQVPPGLLDPQDRKVRRALRDRQAALAQLVKLAGQARRDLLVQEDPQGRPDLLAATDQLVRLALADLLGLLDRLDQAGLPVRQAPLDLPALQAAQALLASRGQLDPLGLQDPKVKQVQPESPAPQVQDPPGLPGRLASPAPPDQLDQQVRSELLGLRDKVARAAQQESAVPLGQPAPLDPKESPAPLASQGLRALARPDLRDPPAPDQQ
jgi:hypothetical protein